MTQSAVQKSDNPFQKIGGGVGMNLTNGRNLLGLVPRPP